MHNFENVERSCFVLSLVCITERVSSYEYSADRMLENHLLLELISKNRVLQLVNLKQHSEKGHNIFNNFLYFKIYRIVFHSHEFYWSASSEWASGTHVIPVESDDEVLVGKLRLFLASSAKYKL